MVHAGMLCVRMVWTRRPSAKEQVNAGGKWMRASSSSGSSSGREVGEVVCVCGRVHARCQPAWPLSPVLLSPEPGPLCVLPPILAHQLAEFAVRRLI